MTKHNPASAPQTMPRGTITIRNYTMPTLTLNETVRGMEVFFQKTARVPDLLTSDSYEDFLLFGNVLITSRGL